MTIKLLWHQPLSTVTLEIIAHQLTTIDILGNHINCLLYGRLSSGHFGLTANMGHANNQCTHACKIIDNI